MRDHPFASADASDVVVANGQVVVGLAAGILTAGKKSRSWI
jgi:hypothetical protein